MKIVSLVAENVKKLVAVEIRPDGNLVEITGRNGQGKTSVLDSIWWALTGTSHIQAAPIRKGADKARIRLDLGELVVMRTFARKEDGGATTSIVVENAEGARYPSPQRMLDALLGELSFDPLAFARMKPKEQFEQLRRFVPGVDFEAIENANRGDYERRTDLNRFAKQERAAADAIIIPPDTPEQLVDEAALIEEMRLAGEHNTDLQVRKANREKVRQDIEALRQKASTALADVEISATAARGRHASLVAESEERIRELEQQIANIRARIASSTEQLESDITRETERLKVQAAEHTAAADALQKRLDEAPELPKPKDTVAIGLRIKHAQETNANVRKRLERAQHLKKAEELEAKSEELTSAIKKRDDDKRAAIAAARMPVPGVEFGSGIVLLNGVPFEQASDAEQLRASVAIAMALSPKLRVIRIRDGSLLDEGSMKLLGEMADAHDMQVWVERVDSSGAVGFVLEDGHVRKASRSTEAAA